MPARTGLSSCSTVLPILPSPSARNVPRCCWLWPIWLRVWVIRTFAIAFLCRFLRLVWKDLGNRQAAHLRHLVGAAEALEAVHGRLGHVDRVRRAEALGQDVADPRQLEHGAHAASGDHARSFTGGSQEDARGIGAAENLVRDRSAVLRDGEEILLRILDGLGDRERHLTCLAVADTHAIDLVTDHDQRREREATAALDDLR